MKGFAGWCDPHAGLKQIDDNEADDQSERRDNFEVHQRLDANASELAKVTDGSDSMNNGAKDNRRDHHLHQLYERIAKRLERLSKLGLEVTDSDPEQHRNDDLDIENAIPRFAGCRVEHGIREVECGEVECDEFTLLRVGERLLSWWLLKCVMRSILAAINLPDGTVGSHLETHLLVLLQFLQSLDAHLSSDVSQQSHQVIPLKVIRFFCQFL